MPIKEKIKVVKSRPGIKDKLDHYTDESDELTIKVKTPRKEYILPTEEITINEATEKVKKEYPTFTEFEYKTITYKKTGKNGEFIKRIDPPEKIEERWQKKKEHIRELSDNVGRLKNRITRDLKGEDEKDFLSALIIAIMLRTGERIGNFSSATYEKKSKNDKRKKAFGVSVFLKKHATIIGNKVHLNYIGKKGVPQDKSFSDEKIAKALKTAIKKSPSTFIFTTSEGQMVTDAMVNKYLEGFNISCKAVRGYSANKWVTDKLKVVTPEDSDKKRKKQLNIILKSVAEKVGHGPSVLKNQYLMPEVVTSWIDKGGVFDIKEAGYVMKEGGKVNSEKEVMDGSNPDIRYEAGSKIPERYKELGFRKVGQKKRSTRPEKKWMVLAKRGNRYKVVHGGQKGMEDFSQHHDKKRQKRFWNRMGGFDSEKSKDPFSPLYWHKRFGTWEKGGVLDDGTIKVAWVDSKTPDTMESKMFDSVDEALKYADGKSFLIFELEDSHDDYYKWSLLPYGMYDKYKMALNWADSLNMMEPGRMTRYRLGGLFHGSSKRFEKFSLKNVGEGGKSVGGWGIYLSTSKDVAGQYLLKSGSMYEVTVSEDGEWMDLDEQIDYSIGEKIATRLQKNGISEDEIDRFRNEFLGQGDGGYDPASGKQVYDYLSSLLGSEKKASEFLLKIGVIGNRFKDKTMPEETNYVVFDADTIRIDDDNVERYENGGGIEQKEHNNILLYPIDERIEFIENVLVSNPYYSQKTLDFKSLAKRANEFIELHLEFNKYNPIVTRYEDRAYFEPDKRHIDREGYLLAQVEYALHFITGSSEDKKQRFYDQAKYEYIKFIIPTLRNPDERLHQKENDSIIYVKSIIEKQYCCAVLYIELDSDGSLRVVTVLPQQKEKQIQKKKASGRWTDASFISLSTEKSSSDEAVSGINDDIDDSHTQDKDTNNNDTDKKKLETGGNIDKSIKIFDKDEILKEKGINLHNNDDFANSEKIRKFIPTKITKDELQSIISGKSKISNGDTIQRALAYIRTEKDTNSINRRAESEIEKERLIEFIDGGSIPESAQKQIDEYIKEGIFIDPTDKPAVGTLSISRFSGPDADIHPNQLSVDHKGVEKWKKRIEAGERPYVLIDYVEYLNENRVKDAHHRLAAYEQLGFTEIPVIDVNGKILNASKMAVGGSVDGDYKMWKRRNVTYRGMKEIGVANKVHGSLGNGLYTAPLSNKSMAKEYGTLYFVVNGRPKNPKKFNSLNEWEIWFYNTLVFKYSQTKGKEFPDKRDFEAKTTIESEMKKLGYDGIEISGREMVNFTPPVDVMYFRTEDQLRDYYDRKVARMEEGGMVFNENLSYLLKDKGQTTHIGEETGNRVANGISFYKSPIGSYRYVKYVNGIPVSAIQVMSRDGINGYVSNAYTDPRYRRQGHGMDIISKIRKDFSNVTLSDDLSRSGRLFKEKVSATNRGSAIYQRELDAMKRKNTLENIKV